MPLDAAVGDRAATRLRSAARHSTSACSCGTPKLVVMRVVQPPPGPMPTLMPLAPRSSRKRAPSAVATLPAISSTSAKRLRNSRDRPLHHRRVAVRDVDDEHVDAGAHQLRGALEVVAASRRWRRRRAAGPASSRVANGQALLVEDVARRHQAEQAPVVVDERQLLDLALDHQRRRPLRAIAAPRLVTSRSTRRHARRRRVDSGASTKRTSRSVSRPVSRCVAVDDDQRADARPPHQRGGLARASRPAPMVSGSGMTPCCVRLTFCTSRTCGSMSPGRKPRSMMPMPPSSACTIGHRRARDRVHVGRDDRPVQREARRQAGRQVDGRRIAALEDAAAAARAGSRRTCSRERHAADP